MMEQKTILYPLLGLAGWSMFIAVVMIRRAFRAVGEGLNPEYFRYGKGFEAPDYMLAAYHHFSNLYEMPVLFYAVVLTIYVTAANSALLLGLAWGYVVARIVHSRFHLSNHNVRHRRNAFIVSFVILVLMWGITVFGMFG